MTMKELMKFCSNVMSSTSKMNALSMSRRPLICSQCLNNRKFSSAQKALTPMRTGQNLNKNSRSCIAFSVKNSPEKYSCSKFICHKYCTVSAKDSVESGSNVMEFSDDATKNVLSKDMQVINNFVTEEEEEALFKEVEPHLKRLRYESSHWDDVRRNVLFLT